MDDAILAAAAQVVAEHGWHDLTLERVAEAAGRSRVTLYRRGVTKDAVIEALAVGVAQGWQAAVWPVLTGPGSAADRLRSVLHACCDVIEKHLHLLAGLSTAPDPVFHVDHPGLHGHQTRDIYVRPFERLINDGQIDGSLRSPLDPTETATLIFNIFPRVYLHLRVAHKWEPERAEQGLVAIMLPALVFAEPDDSGGQ